MYKQDKSAQRAENSSSVAKMRKPDE